MRGKLLVWVLVFIVPPVVHGQFIPEPGARLRYDAATRTYMLRMVVEDEDGRKRQEIATWESKSQFEASVESRVAADSAGTFRYSYRFSNLRSSRQPIARMFLPDVGTLMVKDGDRRCIAEPIPVGWIVLSANPLRRGPVLCVEAPKDFRMTLLRPFKSTGSSMLIVAGGGSAGLVPAGSAYGPVTVPSPALPMLQRAGLEGLTPKPLSLGEGLSDEERSYVNRWYDEDMVWVSVIAPGTARPEPYARARLVEAIVADVRRWSDRRLPEAVRTGEIAGLIEAAGRAEGAALEAALADLVNRTEAMPELSVNAKHLMQVYAQIIRRAPEKS